jgi:hypothetical protein
VGSFSSGCFVARTKYGSGLCMALPQNLLISTHQLSFDSR